MTEIKTNVDERNELLNVAWWMHLGTAIQGDIFVCGDLHAASLNLLLTMCDRVFIFENSNCVMEKDSHVIRVNNKTYLDYTYDAIILDCYNNFYDYGDAQIISLITDRLNNSGAICIYEPNSYSLRNNDSTILSKLRNIFSDCRLNMFSQLTKNTLISKYQTFTYDKNPYETNKIGTCSSNKNTFTLKEKIKKILLKSPFSRLISNSNIWVVQKGDTNKNLIYSIIDYLKKQSYLKKYTKIDYEIIYYKHSKIIFSLKDHQFDDEFIVVIALDDEAIRQRTNEKKTIEYLRSIDQVNKLITDEYYSENINGLNCYIMKSYQGITVDIKTNDSKLMIDNVYKELIKLSNSTLNLNTDNDTHITSINKYFDILLKRWPTRTENISKIRNYISNILEKNVFMTVCMHGDFKLENSVLNKHGMVEGIIDWELSVINGLPLIDLLYLITYNHQVDESKEFEDVYSYLLNNTISPYELELIDEYCKMFSINEQIRFLLILVFFVHHYSCRFYLDERSQSMIHIDKCLELMVEKIKVGVA